MANYQVSVYQAQQLLTQLTLDSPVLVGRRDPGLNDPAPVALHTSSNGPRLVVAETNVSGIPRSWFRLSCDANAGVLVKNLHAAYRVRLSNSQEIAAEGERRFKDEVSIDLGFEIRLQVRPAVIEEVPESGEFRHIGSILQRPGEDTHLYQTMTLRQFPVEGGTAIVDLLRVALQVVQKAAGSDAFFQKAVEATTAIVGLDRAMILMRPGAEGGEEIVQNHSLPNGWITVANYFAPGIQPQTAPSVSESILARVSTRETATVILDATQQKVAWENAPSLFGVQCVVASPILNVKGELIGTLYGDRWSQGSQDQNRISEIEATLVEVLAGAVAGGIARKSEERRRGNLSGFFSPRVADLLAASPELLLGQDVEISVLFCDIRGFSSVTEKMGPQKTIEWINDVLSELSQCVVDTDGVLVDYVGDELMAMWGAPGIQTDHALRAVRTAIAMLQAIETLRERWADVLPTRFGAGIGVNTGPARVGNVGSRWKFKYGVLGNTVNVGSRLQAATKQLEVDCMISRQTAIQAGCTEQARRLAKLAVVGIEEAIDVYQIVYQPDSEWESLVREYQCALLDFEKGKFSEATRRLGEIIPRHHQDRPCRQLLARAAEQLNEPSANFSPVWRLTKK